MSWPIAVTTAGFVCDSRRTRLIKSARSEIIDEEPVAIRGSTSAAGRSGATASRRWRDGRNLFRSSTASRSWF